MSGYSIESGWPPNIESIRAVLPVSENNIFAYGGVIYNPGGRELPPWLIEHEQVHFRQQGWRPARWWKKFLKDPVFRLKQELEAHRAEYQCYCFLVLDRNSRAMALSQISRRLAAPMYGGIISIGEARRLIQ